jgi:hypothetical protein
MKYSYLSFITFIIIFSYYCFSQIPQTMSYQGMLNDSEGQMVSDGTYSMTFIIYDQATEGSIIWEESQNVDVANGLFNVILGENNPLNITFNQTYWLGITIAGGDELAPRIELTASPYSLNAQQVLGTNIFPADGYVGIGTSDPEYQFEVTRNITLAGGGPEGGQMTLLDADREGGWEMDNYGESGNEEIRVFRDKGFNDQFSVLHIKSNGNVGIATGNPEEKLEVDGIISSINGGFKFPDGSVQTTAADGSGGNGDITSVNAGNGLTGGATTGEATLDVGAGTGISVSADAVALNTTYTDGRYVNEEQENSISTGMITPNVLSSVDGVSNDGGNVDLVAGSNVTITPNDAENTIMISSSGGTGGGDITAVTAGAGLTGGGITADVNLDVGAGTGISVSADAVALNTTYTDGRYVNEGQESSISASMITPNVLSSVDGVSNDGGNVDLVAGSNVTITPDDGANRITISASGGTGSGNTLDQAYDQGGAGAGRTITADAGAVEINGDGGLMVNGPTTSNGLEVTGGGHEGGQITLMDGDGEGGWEVDNYGESGTEKLRIFRGRGFNDIYDALVLQNNGRVGIGTGSPDEKLHVSGVIHSSDGGFRFPDGTLQTTAAEGTGDNLGNHTATENVNMNGFWLSGSGNDDGIFLSSNGRVGIGTNVNLNSKVRIEYWDGFYGSGASLGSADCGVNGYHLNDISGYLGGRYYGAYGQNGEGFVHSYGYLGGWDYSVYGEFNNGNYGFLGSESYGVFGHNGNSEQFAGYFSGNLRCTGTLYKGGGGFKIDHPLFPANKYLNHSFVESPDMKNIYDGIAIMDANGEAIVELPEWFESLNSDFRYQLTCIGEYAQVFIAEKLNNNRFKIAGGYPDMEVSWQVTGIRQDAYANAHRIPVEEDKTGREVGKYQNPMEHGVLETLGIGYEERIRIEAKQKQIEEEREKLRLNVEKHRSSE